MPAMRHALVSAFVWFLCSCDSDPPGSVSAAPGQLPAGNSYTAPTVLPEPGPDDVALWDLPPTAWKAQDDTAFLSDAVEIIYGQSMQQWFATMGFFARKTL